MEFALVQLQDKSQQLLVPHLQMHLMVSGLLQDRWFRLLVPPDHHALVALRQPVQMAQSVLKDLQRQQQQVQAHTKMYQDSCTRRSASQDQSAKPLQLKLQKANTLLMEMTAQLLSTATVGIIVLPVLPVQMLKFAL